MSIMIPFVSWTGLRPHLSCLPKLRGKQSRFLSCEFPLPMAIHSVFAPLTPAITIGSTQKIP